MIRMLLAAGILPGWVLARTYTSLFDGASLAGWKVQCQGTWEVKDSAIVGSGTTSNPKNTWLVSDKATYRDFDFRFRFKGVSGNSGLNFRSIQGTEDVAGVQVDIDTGRSSGSLYDVLVRNGTYAGAYLVQPPASQIISLQKPVDWNLVELKARGNPIEVSLNGTLVVTYDLTKGEPQGFFAFQLHDKAVTKISLRDFEIAEVSASSLLPRSFPEAKAGSPALASETRAWDLAGRRIPVRTGVRGPFRLSLTGFHLADILFQVGLDIGGKPIAWFYPARMHRGEKPSQGTARPGAEPNPSSRPLRT